MTALYQGLRQIAFRDGNVAVKAESEYRYARGRAEQVQYTAGRTKNRQVFLTVAVIIARNRYVARHAPGIDRYSRGRADHIPGAVARTVDSDIVFPVTVVIGGNTEVPRRAPGTDDRAARIRAGRDEPGSAPAENSEVGLAVAVIIPRRRKIAGLAEGVDGKSAGTLDGEPW